MPLIGLTGGIATGKSAATRLLAQRGATTFSADEAARAVLVRNGPALRRIAQEFGSEMLTPLGDLDRARLGHTVFADPEARRRLEQILHPLIRSLLRAQIEAAQRDLGQDTLIVVEIPLLYEGGLETWFDQVIVVTAPRAIQIDRLRTRNGLDAEEASRRIAAQWPLEDKVVRADYVLVNDGSLPQLEAAIKNIWPLLNPRRKSD
ncbi:MAG: dephospho-CoA kinase [Chthonomonadales bacterium]|nr:dephospho-CoA kinase [Chthonomonadales bacterium]